MPTAPSKDIEDAYQWASCLTSEGRGVGWVADQFLWTDQARAAKTKLQFGNGILLAVSGAIGAGKSSLHQALTLFTEGTVPRGAYVVSLKWPRSGGLYNAVFSELLGSSRDFQEAYQDALHARPGFNPLRGLNYPTRSSKHGPMRHLDGMLSAWEAQARGPAAMSELALPPKEVAPARREALLTYFANAHTILIDLPDYSRSDLRSLTRNLLEIQDLWNATLDPKRAHDPNHRANLVIFIQREMLDRKGALTHYFFGKFDTIRLKPLSPSELIEIYRLRWSSTKPFNESSLERVARLARGNPRRFLNYVSRCLEYLLTQGSKGEVSLTPETLEKAIPDEQVMADLENEMIDLYPRSVEMRRMATLLVRFLIERTPDQFSQTELASHLGLGTVEATRLLQPLEQGGFVVKGKGTGATKTVRALV